jgi:hypothetical protein
MIKNIFAFIIGNIVFYLIASFVLWDIQWIPTIATYLTFERFIIVMILLLWNLAIAQGLKQVNSN